MKRTILILALGAMTLYGCSSGEDQSEQEKLEQQAEEVARQNDSLSQVIDDAKKDIEMERERLDSLMNEIEELNDEISEQQ